MDTFRGSRTLLSFAPRWTDPEILEKTLVGRGDLVDRLEELAIDGAGGPNKHQRLIVGPRGSGKTHVLKALHHRLWCNEELKKRLLIVYAQEDEMGVAEFLDLIVRLLRAIISWYSEHQQLAGDLEALADLPPAAREARAVELLFRAAGSKDILILIENLAFLFDKAKGFGRRGQQALRDLVQRHPRFMIFGSSQALMEAVRDRNAPFFGFFKVIHLRRLELEEAMAFLIAIASAYGKPDVVRFLNTERGRGRMQAVYDFTGGNHRLLVTFYDFVCTDSVAKLSELFMEALEPLRPYYQEQMRSLSAQQQKIVQFLCLQREPQSVKEIARGCLTPSNTISSQLRDLLDRGFVARRPQGRESYYELAEALFRICYQADLEQAGAPVRLFVDFLESLYTAQELLRRRRGFEILAEKLGDSGSVPFSEEARFYERALSLYHPELAGADYGTAGPKSGSEDSIRSFLSELEKESAHLELTEFARHLGDRKDAFVLHTEARAYARLGQFEEALTAASKALEKDPNDVKAHLVLAWVYSQRTEGRETALVHARRAFELAPGDPRTLAATGLVLVSTGDHEGALERFEVLTKEHPAYADGWGLAGLALGNLGRTQEAGAAYRRALELDSSNAKALRGLGALLFDTGRHAEALEQFQALNRVSPGDSDGWSLTGQALLALGRRQEAEAAYRRALQLDSSNGEALRGLGALLFDTGRHAEALEQFQALNRVNPEESDGWRLAGQALLALGRTQEAEPAYRRALELDSSNAKALGGLGALLGNAGRHAEALQQFQALNRVSPGDPDGWRLTGQALLALGRRQEAEAACRRALELDSSNPETLRGLGIVLFNSGSHAEALEQFQALNRVSPEDSDGWSLTGQALRALDRRQEAEAAYRRALQLDSSNAEALGGLGALLGDVGRYAEALEQFQALNRVSPEDSDGWSLTGQALRALDRRQEAEAAYRRALELDSSNGEALRGLGALHGKASRYAEALEQFQALNRVSPEDSDGWRLTGQALRALDRPQEAEAAYRRALELDATSGPAWGGLRGVLEQLGRREEAARAFDEAIRLGGDRAELLNSRGEARRSHGEYRAAIADYEEALCADPGGVLPHFNIVSALLALGKTEDALARLQAALEAAGRSGPPAGPLVTQSLYENCTALFENAPEEFFESYLTAAQELIGGAGYMKHLEDALPITVFTLLRDHPRISEERFRHIVRSFERVIGQRLDVSVAIRFLRVGIDHFKKRDRKALLSLPREERLVFCKQLGIEFA